MLNTVDYVNSLEFENAVDDFIDMAINGAETEDLIDLVDAVDNDDRERVLSLVKEILG